MRQELTIKATADVGCHTVISLELGGPGCLSPILFHGPVCRVSQRPPTSGWSGFRKVSGSSGGRHKTLKLALAFLTLPSTHLPAAQRPCREAHPESGLGTRLQHGGVSWDRGPWCLPTQLLRATGRNLGSLAFEVCPLGGRKREERDTDEG